MPFPLAAAILGSAAAGLVGGRMSDNSAKRAAMRAYRQNKDAAQSAHQWEVEDLRKAGLNPILSGTGGSGAHMAGAPVAQTGETGRGLAKAGQALMEYKMQSAELENIQAQTAKTHAETENANIIGVDLENTNDAKWGTGTDKGQVYKENQAKLEEAVTRIAEGRQRVSSAKETQRKEKMLNDAMEGNPKLKEYVLSASYAEQETINRALSQAGTAADFFSILKTLLPHLVK